MSENSRLFYLEQLKAHLEFYREIGITGLRVEPSYLLQRSFEQRMRSGPASEGSGARQNVSEKPPLENSDVGSSTERENSLTLFETDLIPRNSIETLDQVLQDLGDCQRCKLCSTRQNIVFGSGNPQAALVFVGEGPGADEDEQGLPFVGKAGQLLTKIIEAIRLKREEVYICNVVKCRPPGNRFPEPDEIAACSPFLFRQLGAIQPKIISCLGATAAQTVLNTKAPIGKLRGRFHDLCGIKVMPTWHPSYLLRNPDAKRDVWEDMKKIRTLLDEIG